MIDLVIEIVLALVLIALAVCGLSLLAGLLMGALDLIRWMRGGEPPKSLDHRSRVIVTQEPHPADPFERRERLERWARQRHRGRSRGH